MSLALRVLSPPRSTGEPTPAHIRSNGCSAHLRPHRDDHAWIVRQYPVAVTNATGNFMQIPVDDAPIQTAQFACQMRFVGTHVSALP